MKTQEIKMSEKRSFEEPQLADVISKQEACVIAGITMPTLNKFIRNGELKEYTHGFYRKYMLKSEIIAAIKSRKQQ